jgi:hypothetical protein
MEIKYFNMKSKHKIEPFKCTGRFKDDFDSICQQKNLKYIPEVISRSKTLFISQKIFNDVILLYSNR